MICYRDMTFCPFWKECKDGKGCDRALTPEVKKKAVEWFGKYGAPICRYVDKPRCFRGIKNGTSD